MTPDDARKVLESLSLFQQVEPGIRGKLLDLFLKTGKIESHDTDAMLLHEGDVGGDIGFVLLDGAVRVSRDAGGELTLPAPAMLGEMQQLNPHATRTATVTAAGPCTVLRFGWMPLYLEARMSLDEAAQSSLQAAIETLVWDRFHQEAMLDAPIFSGLSHEQRLKLCLTLLWISKRKVCQPGQSLFEQDAVQGSTGFLVMKGAVKLERDGQHHGERVAPDILGLTQEFDPQRKWSLSAVALTPVLALRFDWNELEAYLIQRATAAGSEAILGTLRKNAEGRLQI